MVDDIKVSVCVVAYNHGKYIEECVQSILNQVVDFRYEIIIGDDLSTDETRDILIELQQKNPDVIRLLFHEENIGATRNYLKVHAEAKGEYVCHMDGDDFWLPGKMASQSAILDENPSYSQTWTFAKLVNDNGTELGVFPSKLAKYFYPSVISARDIASSYAVVGHHSTQMYRRSCRANLKPPCSEVLDFWFAFNYSLTGPSYYSKEVLSAYRITSSPSVTRSKSNKKATVDYLADNILDLASSNPEYKKFLRTNMIVRFIFSMLAGHDLKVIRQALYSTKDYGVSLKYLVRSMFYFLIQKIK
ncbi:MAG: hypothetical protein COB09_08490 [Thalassobium sp.]|nr:MAG: hypothetical protein COB09_08490 [Thalassobium sp.]